jgi:hypothetical protein
VPALFPALKPRLRLDEAKTGHRDNGEDARHQQQIHLDLLSLLLMKRLPG